MNETLVFRLQHFWIRVAVRIDLQTSSAALLPMPRKLAESLEAAVACVSG